MPNKNENERKEFKKSQSLTVKKNDSLSTIKIKILIGKAGRIIK